MTVTPIESTPKNDEKPKTEEKPYDPADDDFDDSDQSKGKEKDLDELNKKKEKEREREKDRDRFVGGRSYRSGDYPTPSGSDMGYGTAPSEFSASFGSASTTPLR